jgi:hypothetical protein
MKTPLRAGAMTRGAIQVNATQKYAAAHARLACGMYRFEMFPPELRHRRSARHDAKRSDLANLTQAIV